MRGELTRREVIQRMGHGVATGVATLVARHAHAQAPQSAQPSRVSPPSVVSSPPRDFSPGAPPVTYPDPDVLTIDPAFNALRLTNTSIQRL